MLFSNLYNTVFSASVLRPPQLKPTSNPFYKLAEKSENVETEKENPPQSEPVERLQDKKEEVDSPKFVPLASGGATTRSSSTVPAPAQPTTATSSAGFVFGQNISERVVMADSVNNGDATGLDHSSSNGTSELLFTNAAASVKENNQVFCLVIVIDFYMNYARSIKLFISFRFNLGFKVVKIKLHSLENTFYVAIKSKILANG